MAPVKLLVGSALLLSGLFLPLASAQTVDPNAPLPPPPTYGDPQPVYPPPGDGQPYTPPPPEVQPAPPPQGMAASPYSPYRRMVRYRPQFGLGVRAVGLYTQNSLLGYGQGGANFDLMLRVHPRLTLELSVGYHRTDQYDAYYSDYLRSDAPIILGMRIHPGPLQSAISPYFVVGAGADFASADLPDVGESGILGEIQGGGGLEFRIGRHMEFSLDLRGFGRFRGANAPQIYVMDIQGRSVPILGNQGGVMFNAGFGIFF